MILRGNFSSEILHLDTGIQILIPDKVDGPFRIVYLLHGLHGDDGSWLDNTMLPFFAKKQNTVFVMPDVNRSFYANQKYGRRYFDYISEELPQVCRRYFNISAKREDTAIIGASMGGFGALLYALSLPEQYGFCGAISTACLDVKYILESLQMDTGVYLSTGPEAREILTDLYAIYGDELLYREDYDATYLAKNFPKDKPRPKIYATCGTEDDLRKQNLHFRDDMLNTQFDFTYEEWPGGHDWIFFNEALRKTLELWFSL